jgi:hypothetical protein
VSFWHSQQSVIVLCPLLDESNPHPHCCLNKINFTIILSSTPWSSKWSSPTMYWYPTSLYVCYILLSTIPPTHGREENEIKVQRRWNLNNQTIDLFIRGLFKDVFSNCAYRGSNRSMTVNYNLDCMWKETVVAIQGRPLGGASPGRWLRGGAEKAVTDRPHVNT